MDHTREVIVHNFSRWAAASAARQGASVRGRAWYKHIDAIDRKSLFLKCRSEDDFGKWHESEVKKLSHSTGEVIGWSAKILNMVTKVEVYLAGLGHSGFKPLIHPPIDNRLINAVILGCRERCWGERSQEVKELCSKGKPINGIVSYKEYLRVIEGLRIVAKLKGWPLFEVESLWDG